jgi:hypothetical protein
MPDKVSNANADPVARTTVKRRSLLPIYFKKTKNKTLRVLAYVLDPGSALAIARWSGVTTAFVFF